jgi:two-component system, OmpR family, response regulator CpxR
VPTTDTGVTLQTGQQHSVLVVEDEHDARTLMRELLEDAGYTVFTAANGRDAIAMARTMNPPPRLILLDLRMPIMDGWDFVAELRKHGQLAGIPIGVQSGEQDRTLPDGVSFVLSKPIDPDALLALVRHHCG